MTRVNLTIRLFTIRWPLLPVILLILFCALLIRKFLHNSPIGPYTFVALLIVWLGLIWTTLSKRYAINTTLVTAATLIAFTIIEFGLFRVGLTYLPDHLRGHLPAYVYPLQLGAKNSILPRNFTMLVGDSYAFGSGDWMLSHDADKDFHPRERTYIKLLHDATGRDVLNFARPGASPPEGFLLHPIGVFEHLNDISLTSLDHPDTIIALFYAGNDFEDALDFSRRYLHLESDAITFTKNLSRFDSAKGNLIRNYSDHFLPEVTKPFPITRFLVKSILFPDKTPWGVKRSATIDLQADTGISTFGMRTQYGNVTILESPPRSSNLANAHGDRTYRVPNDLQPPPLTLTDSQITYASELTARSLQKLQTHFPHSEIHVIYIPSVAGCYSFKVGQVITRSPYGRKVYFETPSTTLIRKEIRAFLLFSEALKRHGFVPINSTDYFVKATPQGPLHGPQDWRHFNRVGQAALAKFLVKFVGE